MDVVGILLSVVFVVMAAVFMRKRWRFTDTPTSDAGHVFPGLTEVQGVVEAIGQPGVAASDGAACVWWHYIVEQEYTTTSPGANRSVAGFGDPVARRRSGLSDCSRSAHRVGCRRRTRCAR